MERVEKENIVLYNEKSNNVATIKGAFGILSYILAIIIIFANLIMFPYLNVVINSYISNSNSKNWGVPISCLVIIIIASAVILTRLLLLKTPKMYFIGKDLYIKESKDFYLKVLPEELEGYSWKTYRDTMSASSISRAYWGKINLIINGEKYTLSCSSLKKTKHYIDGFKKGLSVEENLFDGDQYQSHTRKTILPLLVWLVISIGSFTTMFFSMSNVLSTISVIIFSLSCVMLLILLIYSIVKGNKIAQILKDNYYTFVLKKPVNFSNKDECDDISKNDCN
ncbi:MAG: hypothetical protein HFE34_04505 [Clostridia bacterium]|jgi:hypothetical protein|nr:hypothetical protein [Clostridia bacterium]